MALKISVIVPSYNQAPFLKKNIDSLVSQSYPYKEIIVMDGGSTDGSVEVMKSYGERISWVSQKDGGQADALKKGIARATGEIIGWLNSDDVYEAGTLEAVAQYFEKHPVKKWAVGRCNIIDENGREIRKFVTDYKNTRLRNYSFKALLRENFIPQMSVFMRKPAVAEAGGVDESLGHVMDYDLWVKLGRISDPGFIDRNLASFRMWSASKSLTAFYDQIDETTHVLKKLGFGAGVLFWHRLYKWRTILLYKLLFRN